LLLASGSFIIVAKISSVRTIDGGQKLNKLHLSKVGLFLRPPLAYSPRPAPKEIVALHHYSLAIIGQGLFVSMKDWVSMISKPDYFDMGPD